MTDRAFFPPAGVWHVWPHLAGWDCRVPWLSCHDLGRIVEHVFAQPQRFTGAQLRLAADVRSLRECKETYARVRGRGPLRIPMPPVLLERFAPDAVNLWRWTRTAVLDVNPETTRSILPDALSVEAWLRQTSAPHGRSRVHL